MPGGRGQSKEWSPRGCGLEGLATASLNLNVVGAVRIL